MARFALFVLLGSMAATFAGAAPVPSTNEMSKRAFVAKAYADFQISDGTAGGAQAKANAVFVTPFAGQNLATVDSKTAAAVETMRQAAEAAETGQFNPQIAAASGAAATALQNGKIQNKVLKLTGEIQVLNIKMAQAKAAGKSTAAMASKIAEETTKLNNNIALDKKASGQASKGVA